MAKAKPVGDESLRALMGSMRLATETKNNYLIRIRQYLKHVGMTADQFIADVKRHPKVFEKQFTEFLQDLQPKVSPSTMAIFRDSIKKLLEVNRINSIDWTYIKEYIPKHKKFGEDRAPTLEEVRKIVELANLRMKCVVLFLASSGARIGSVTWLRWRDIEEVELDGKKFARATIYRGEPEQYTTFVTPECYAYLMDYRKYRESLGEKVTPQSFVFVTEPNKRDPDPKNVRQVSVKTLKNQLGELLKTMGIRSTLERKRRYRNYEFKQAHGFRKFFKTRMEMSGVKPIITEMLMGHGIGVSASYMKPTEKELLEEYSKAIDNLTILGGTRGKEDIKNAFREQLMLVAGFKQEEVDKMDLNKITDEELQQTIRQKLLGMMANNGNKQRVVPINQVRELIHQGWEYVAQLPTGEAIVRLPL